MTSEAIKIAAKIEAMTTWCPNTGCQLWLGAASKQGYGSVCFRGRSASAHRTSYELAKGPIPKGLVIDHLCRVPACVNPDHLEAVTNLENTLRGMNFIATRKRQTHCKHGHELSGSNLMPGSLIMGWRNCKKCHAANTARYKKKLKLQNTQGG